MNFDVFVGGLVAVDDDFVAGLPPGDAVTDLPDDVRAVGPADVVADLGLVAVAEYGNGLLEGILGLALGLFADKPRCHLLWQFTGLGFKLAHI